MITVTVKLYGTLRRFSQNGTPGLWRGEVRCKTSLLELIELIGSSEAEVAGATVNEEFVPMDYVLTENAEIRLVTHMGGGFVNILLKNISCAENIERSRKRLQERK